MVIDKLLQKENMVPIFLSNMTLLTKKIGEHIWDDRMRSNRKRQRAFGDCDSRIANGSIK